jgi:hypothetical protein
MEIARLWKKSSYVFFFSKVISRVSTIYSCTWGSPMFFALVRSQTLYCNFLSNWRNSSYAWHLTYQPSRPLTCGMSHDSPHKIYHIYKLSWQYAGYLSCQPLKCELSRSSSCSTHFHSMWTVMHIDKKIIIKIIVPEIFNNNKKLLLNVL